MGLPEREFDRKRGFVAEAVVRSAIVEIQAPAAIVWEILADLDHYGEWNPFCVRCVSTLDLGAPRLHESGGLCESWPAQSQR